MKTRNPYKATKADRKAVLKETAIIIIFWLAIAGLHFLLVGSLKGLYAF